MEGMKNALLAGSVDVENHTALHGDNAMNQFMQRHASSILGELHGFDRVRFRGTPRLVANADGLGIFLHRMGVKLKDFKGYAMGVTERLKSASLAVAHACRRPVHYLPSATQSKEDLARQIAAADRVREGLVCALTCVEPCMAFEIRKNQQGLLQLRSCLRKCLHVYHYHRHPVLGWMHARLQTWFPFTIKVGINGREWLARQMDRKGLGYQQRDNCFVSVERVAAAQALLDRQLRTNWARVLGGIARNLSPGHAREFKAFPLRYYWSADETEWASDVMFRSSEALAGLYPQLIRHSIVDLGSHDVLRFLQRRCPGTDRHMAPNRFEGELVSDLKHRPEGLRLKHTLNHNSIKMYDKQGSVLRVETTINDARQFKVFRRPEGQTRGPQRWLLMRKGIADLHRRAQVSQRANDRYFQALSAVETSQPLHRLVGRLCRPTQDHKGRRVRALNPLAGEDAVLLEAIGRGEFLINGLRNRDLRAILHPQPATDPATAKRHAAAISRKLRMLVAHGLLQKIQHTHRYQVTAEGRRNLAALAAARAADVQKLAKAA
jgi:hypothetical protein